MGKIGACVLTLALIDRLPCILLFIAAISNDGVTGRHQVAIKHVAGGGHIVDVKTPFAQVLLGIIEDLASLVAVHELRASVARNDRCVIEEVQKTTAVTGENDLFFGALDGSGELCGVGLLKFLASLFPDERAFL